MAKDRDGDDETAYHTADELQVFRIHFPLLHHEHLNMWVTWLENEIKAQAIDANFKSNRFINITPTTIMTYFDVSK